MNILFITKPFIIEPLGIMYLASNLKIYGHKVDLVCTNEDIEAKIESFKPSIVAYSIMTGDQFYYNGINENIKSKYPHIMSIAGGPHPTFFPEMIDDPVMTFDAVCIGEGEKALLALVTFGMGRGDYKKSHGFWFKTGEKNPIMPLVTDLDSLEYPDRSIVDKYSTIKNNPIKHLIASRGCPYNCTYCFNKSFAELYPNQKRVRFHTVQDVIGEIQQLRTNPATKFLYFQDDTFILNKEWLKEFALHYNGPPFHCHVRANLIDEKTVTCLVAAGCYSVHMAAEAGNDKVRNSILNRQMSTDTIIEAAKIIKNAGIKLMLQNILGLPGTTIQNDLETLELNIACQPDYAWASIFQPYPKTALGTQAKEMGFYTGDFSDLHNNFFDRCPLNYPETHRIQIENLQKLFALTVNEPSLYRSGVLQKMLLEVDDTARESYTEIYRSVRAKGDKILYMGLV